MFACFPVFNVACYNLDYHSGMSAVVYKVLLLNIVIFNLFILNQHRIIVGYSDRLPAIFALILISPLCILQ